ncbi:MAG: nucleotide exchange factor GrpE [Defluviitaleaceae bacterium]|nr:nucleotide exchange factor GrpE [Defluviitaleaceae bacterium]
MAAKSAKLWTLWQKYKQVSAESLSESINKKFSALSRAVCSQIETDAVRFSRLEGSDEEIYVHLVGLMGVYRRVVDLVDGYTFESPSVTALVSGICEVLNSRLREFEEENGDSKDNPISAEKNEILAEALKKAASSVDGRRENFSIGLSSGASEEWDESFEMLLRGGFYEMFSFYREGINFCQTKLDDLHNRKAAGFYTEFTERAWEELGTIIKVQVLALENAGLKENNEDAQATAILCIIDALKEAYKQLEPVAQGLQSRLSAPPKKPIPYCTLEEFESKLDSALEIASPLPKEQKEFFAVLDAETVSMLDGFELDYKKAAYTLKRFIGAKVLLAEEITNVFERVRGTGENQPNSISDIERDILSGIHETIEIKISGLKESIQDFAKNSGEILKKFSSEKSTVPDGERILSAVRTAWLSSPPERDKISEFFKTCKRSDVFAPVRERVESQVSTLMELLEKNALRFKKEVLLYEICTFEEILTHSVSRLRDSDNREIQSVVRLFDETFNALEVILKKNNIEIIRPEIKEPFNAKEHEVLVAEKNLDFEKGEIIKVMTAGYKYSGQIILRANVIAAR